ncbi:MAG: D-alanyl-D-alanine carboxypeptidase/D-alanyl-D-alanine-endopeptidase, partial [Bacteroidales bacterium]|nr:D-alanyl-D-alanine carboxypeptidase/D-alanyl-D-alanine-endopeptidase [Bacteroidales bacterium]
MRKVFLFYCLIFTNLMVFAQAKTYSDLQNELTKLPEFKNASLGLYAVNLSTGDKVFDYNSQTSLAPASVFKIIPTALAIELLGPDYKFKTELAYSGSISSDGVLNGNIYVIGYGDPCLGSQNFAYHYNSNGELLQKWVNEVKKLGIKKINGDIICDISYFGEIPIPDTWIWEDIANYYGNPGSALNYMDNLYYLHFKTGNTDGSPTSLIKVEPEDIGINFNNKVKSSSTTGDESFIYYTNSKTECEIRGTLPWNKSDFSIKGSMPEPEMYLIKSFNGELKSNGIIVTGKEKKNLSFDDKISRKVFHTTYSPELIKIAELTNLKSFNLYAEMLARHIEKKTNKSYSDAVVDFWKSKSVNTDGLIVEDACGLSRFNGLTAFQMVEMLKYMRKKSLYGEQFFNTLPVAGTSGTLSRYCVGTKAQN